MDVQQSQQEHVQELEQEQVQAPDPEFDEKTTPPEGWNGSWKDGKLPPIFNQSNTVNRVMLGGVPRGIHRLLYENLGELRKLQNKKWDAVGLYAGVEGAGKSVKASQDCAIMDKNFSLENVHFRTEKFLDALTGAKDQSAVLLDEGWDSISNGAKKVNERFQQELQELMRMVRSKSLFIAIVAPTFFDVERYYVMHRANYLIYTKAIDGERGYFNFYGRPEMRKLYIYGRKDWNYDASKPAFAGKFSNWMPYTYEEYEAKKRSQIIEKRESRAEREVNWHNLQQIPLNTPDHLLQAFRFRCQVEYLAWLKMKGLLPKGIMSKSEAFFSGSPSKIRLEIHRRFNKHLYGDEPLPDIEKTAMESIIEYAKSIPQYREELEQYLRLDHVNEAEPVSSQVSA